MCFPVGKKEWYDSLVPGKGISSETPFLFKVTGMPSSYFSVHINAVFRQRNLWRNQEYCDTAALFTVKPERGKRHAADSMIRAFTLLEILKKEGDADHRLS